MNLQRALIPVLVLTCAGLLPAARAAAVANEADTNPAPDASTKAAPARSSNPYSIITDRNVFRLVPPPPPPTNDVKADLPVIKISGFLDVGDHTRALFATAPKDAKEAPRYFNLAEGEAEGILELVKIHKEDQTVDVIIHREEGDPGTATTLSIKDNGFITRTEPSKDKEPGHGPGRPGGPRMPGGPGMANRERGFQPPAPAPSPGGAPTGRPGENGQNGNPGETGGVITGGVAGGQGGEGGSGGGGVIVAGAQAYSAPANEGQPQGEAGSGSALPPIPQRRVRLPGQQ